MSTAPAKVTNAGREYRLEEAVILWLTAQQAERRHLRWDADGNHKPLISASWLNQMRSKNERAGRKWGDRLFLGPPYKRIGRLAFYPAAMFDRWVMGRYFDDMTGAAAASLAGQEAVR